MKGSSVCVCACCAAAAGGNLVIHKGVLFAVVIVVVVVPLQGAGCCLLLLLLLFLLLLSELQRFVRFVSFVRDGSRTEKAAVFVSFARKFKQIDTKNTKTLATYLAHCPTQRSSSEIHFILYCSTNR